MTRWSTDGQVQLCTYVDDLTISCKARAKEAAEIEVEAMDWLFGFLEGELQLEVSKDRGVKKGKSVTFASCQWLLNAARRRLKRLGIRYVALTKNLGIQMAGVGQEDVR